jgi:1-deoxy-D-xylulose-5-phosphate synthase
VGADGPTHAGSFDISAFCPLPHIVLMAPSDETELMHMVATAASINDAPSMVRYPRGDGMGLTLPAKGEILPIGKGRIIRKGSAIALLSLGTRLQECLKAADELEKMGLSTTVADARFAKPLDATLIEQLIASHDVLITVEEGANGGFGAHVLALIASQGWLDNGQCCVRTLCLPDKFQEQGIPYAMYEAAGLNASGIITTAQAALKKSDIRLTSAV